MFVLSLIANPNDMALTPQLVNQLAKETGGQLNWLAQGIACDIIAPKAKDAKQIAYEMCDNLPIDINLIKQQGRRKNLLIADMDSTMIEQECIDELADALGIKPQIADITARAMNGELDFEQALETRVALLKGLERKVIEEIRRERISLAQGGRALVQTMKAYGAHTALISGGFSIFADYIAKRIGFDEAIANQLEFENDRLNGKVTKPIVDANVKLNRLEQLAKEKELQMSQTLAVGDGANDLLMIKAAGLGVALHAKPVVAEQAQVKIDFGDLTALLYLQGYGEDDIIR
ncbi:MAG: phosphoserine phosphatase SerB [Devosiaceae bacterium]|nr:phosphoserine phosphatase SerB [Devosiaceae bacterium]